VRFIEVTLSRTVSRRKKRTTTWGYLQRNIERRPLLIQHAQE
jgi:hypothetical protein